MTIEMTLTEKGLFTITQSLMEHLGIKAGEKILVEKKMDGTLSIKPVKTKVSAHTLIGIVKTNIQASDNDIKQAIEQAHAQSGSKGLLNAV